MMVRRVAILGDGQMGLVMADLLAFPSAELTRDVAVWCPMGGSAGLEKSRSSSRLPDFRLPDAIAVTADAAEALAGADLVVNAIPTQFIRSTMERIRSALPRDAGLLNVAKGLETASRLRPSEILRASVGERRIATLSGPSIAAELARRLPAVFVVASGDAGFAEQCREACSSPWTRVYSSDDLTGVELAGAVKNVIAIAAGMIDGLGLGNNAKSALLARGLAEISRLGVALGAKAETFYGVAGVGDLATTCFSPEGRNRSFGELVGGGRTPEEALAVMSSVVEGVATAAAVVDWARRTGVDMPISAAVGRILAGEISPREAVGGLMGRQGRHERVVT
jgi:glycerol-3-phosphate dehydrogenase (NAD(P)+)